MGNIEKKDKEIIREIIEGALNNLFTPGKEIVTGVNLDKKKSLKELISTLERSIQELKENTPKYQLLNKEPIEDIGEYFQKLESSIIEKISEMTIIKDKEKSQEEEPKKTDGKSELSEDVENFDELHKLSSETLEFFYNSSKKGLNLAKEYKKDLEQKEEVIKSLKVKYSQLEKESKNLEEEKNSKIEILKNTVSSNDAKIDDLKKYLGEEQKKFNELTEEIISLNKKIKNENDNYDKLEKEKFNLAKQVKELLSEKNSPEPTVKEIENLEDNEEKKSHQNIKNEELIDNEGDLSSLETENMKNEEELPPETNNRKRQGHPGRDSK